jgi:hypothetical protein
VDGFASRSSRTVRVDVRYCPRKTIYLNACAKAVEPWETVASHGHSRLDHLLTAQCASAIDLDPPGCELRRKRRRGDFCCKNFQAFSRVPNFRRQLHATWTQHEMRRRALWCDLKCHSNPLIRREHFSAGSRPDRWCNRAKAKLMLAAPQRPGEQQI